MLVRTNKKSDKRCLLSVRLCYSKQTAIEIEQLNARVVEAETKLKTEVTRIKKKLQIQITELEMSLDVANKNNIELQKTIKKQSLTLTVSACLNISHSKLFRFTLTAIQLYEKLMFFFFLLFHRIVVLMIYFVSCQQELQAHYDEVQRQLQVTLDQYGIIQRKFQSVSAELEEIRGNYEGVS